MSHVEQDDNQSALQRLKEEISTLREQQIAAEKIAALVGMTPGDSEHYKQRHYQMKRLLRKLAVLDNEQGGHHEQEETQEISGQGTKNTEADRYG